MKLLHLLTIFSFLSFACANPYVGFGVGVDTNFGFAPALEMGYTGFTPAFAGAEFGARAKLGLFDFSNFNLILDLLIGSETEFDGNVIGSYWFNGLDFVSSQPNEDYKAIPYHTGVLFHFSEGGNFKITGEIEASFGVLTFANRLLAIPFANLGFGLGLAYAF